MAHNKHQLKPATAVFLYLFVSTLSAIRMTQAKILLQTAGSNKETASNLAATLSSAFGSSGSSTLDDIRLQAEALLITLQNTGTTPDKPPNLPPTPVSQGPTAEEQLKSLKQKLEQLGIPLTDTTTTTTTTGPPLIPSPSFSGASPPTSSPQAANMTIMTMLKDVLGNSSFIPTVQASSGLPDISSAFYPIGSGDNLLEFRKRVQAVKGYYKDARTYLHVDDAVRIGGYINTLESLGISWVTAFPIAELSFLVANIALGSAICSLLGGIFYTAAAAVGLAASIASLQAANDNAEIARRAQQRSSTRAGSASDTSTLDVSQIQSIIASNPEMISKLVAASQGLDSQLLDWALGGGALEPLAIATNVLTAVSGSLDRLSTWTPIDVGQNPLG